MACGRVTNGCPLNKSRFPSAFGQGSPSSSSSIIGNGVWEKEHGQVVTLPIVGRNLVEYAPQKQCLKNSWIEADMACHCPWVSDPRTKSEGVEESGTGIMPPVHGQTGGSAQSPCSWAHKRNGIVFSGAWAPLGGSRMCCACQGLTTLWAARVNDGLELEVTDPQENKGDVEQEDGES